MTVQYRCAYLYLYDYSTSATPKLSGGLVIIAQPVWAPKEGWCDDDVIQKQRSLSSCVPEECASVFGSSRRTALQQAVRVPIYMRYDSLPDTT